MSMLTPLFLYYMKLLFFFICAVTCKTNNGCKINRKYILICSLVKYSYIY